MLHVVSVDIDVSK